ncbi:transposase family protein [Streptomyces vinaceus]
MKLLLPHLSRVLVNHVVPEEDVLRIIARTDDALPDSCPGCGTSSVRQHSRYGSLLADNAIGGRPVVIELSVRRLFCDNSGCVRVTFAEQVPDLTVRYGRRAPAPRRILEAAGVVLAGLPGARLSSVLPRQSAAPRCCRWSWTCPTRRHRLPGRSASMISP